VIFAFESENPARDSHEAARAGAMQTKPSIAAKETVNKKARQHLELFSKSMDAPQFDLTRTSASTSVECTKIRLG
jgi:hypothetical protein